jgi:hypothetical protein
MLATGYSKFTYVKLYSFLSSCGVSVRPNIYQDYDPWDFVSTSYGKTWWGDSDDKSAIEQTFVSLQQKFNAPALIGEWGTTEQSVERGASWVYWDYLVRTAASYNLTTMLWDNSERKSLYQYRKG